MTRILIITRVVETDAETMNLEVAVASYIDGDLQNYDRQKSSLKHFGDWQKESASFHNDLSERALGLSTSSE